LTDGNQGNRDLSVFQDHFQQLCCEIEQEKSVFKIVTKTKNESFFIERWLKHHIPIVGNSKIIVFDNISTDKNVISIYKKYKENILLAEFNGFMDKIHMANFCMPLYKALSNSSDFFTIIDSDEYLYLSVDDKIVHDDSVRAFLRNNTEVNFFPTYWLENINADDGLFQFNPRSLRMFHLGKPIVNAKIISKFEKYRTLSPILHHTKDLPLSAHGRAPTCFLLLHLKNLNRYQRIRANMEKLAAFKVITDRDDFENLFRMNAESVRQNHVRDYIMETRKLVKNTPSSGGHAEQNIDEAQLPHGKIGIAKDGTLRFTPECLESEFKRQISAASDYFELIGRSPTPAEFGRYATIQDWLQSIGQY
jgi:hypothetical protein